MTVRPVTQVVKIVRTPDRLSKKHHPPWVKGYNKVLINLVAISTYSGRAPINSAWLTIRKDREKSVSFKIS